MFDLILFISEWFVPVFLAFIIVLSFVYGISEFISSIRH